MLSRYLVEGGEKLPLRTLLFLFLQIALLSTITDNPKSNLKAQIC